jgi:hypothetical protein
MDTKLAEIQSAPIEFDVLREIYRAYGSPKDKIARLAKAGTLVRLKKGLYVVSPSIAAHPVSPCLVANRLYGPSYVSMQTALSLYHMIPEHVYATLSVTIKRSKIYNTPLGRYEYLQIPPRYFPIGIQMNDNGNTAYLIATPEKALCDMIVLSRMLRIQSKTAMREFIEDDLRIDMSAIDRPDISIIDAVIESGVKRREMLLLKEYIHG